MTSITETAKDEELEKLAQQYRIDIGGLVSPSEAFKAGFRKSESLRSVQWPSEEEVIAEAKSSTFKYIPNSIDYESGFVNCYDWLKERVMMGEK